MYRWRASAVEGVEGAKGVEEVEVVEGVEVYSSCFNPVSYGHKDYHVFINSLGFKPQAIEF
jgi:hypothetical protein